MVEVLRIEDYVPTSLPGEADVTAGEVREPDWNVQPAVLLEESSARTLAFERHRAATSDGTRRLVRDVRKAHPGNLDELIERLRAIETRTAATLDLASEVPAHDRLAYGESAPRLKIELTKSARRQQEAVRETLEALRDARWELMAARAETEDQQGTVFETPEELLRHLDRL